MKKYAWTTVLLSLLAPNLGVCGLIMGISSDLKNIDLQMADMREMPIKYETPYGNTSDCILEIYLKLDNAQFPLWLTSITSITADRAGGTASCAGVPIPTEYPASVDAIQATTKMWANKLLDAAITQNRPNAEANCWSRYWLRATTNLYYLLEGECLAEVPPIATECSMKAMKGEIAHSPISPGGSDIASDQVFVLCTQRADVVFRVNGQSVLTNGGATIQSENHFGDGSTVKQITANPLAEVTVSNVVNQTTGVPAGTYSGNVIITAEWQ